jgi:hypothetical protein
MAMLRLLSFCLDHFAGFFSSRRNLWFENLALRQQLMVFERKRNAVAVVVRF